MPEPLSVSIEFSDEMAERIKRRAKSLQFHDLRFYVRWLIAKDVAPESEDADLIMALIYEGMNSGEAIPYDDAFKRELIERTDRIIAEKVAARASRAAG